MQEAQFNLAELSEHFNFSGTYTNYVLSNKGNINNTFILNFKEPSGKINKYLLQQINTYVFKRPDELMENIMNVTSFLRRKLEETGGDPQRETLTFLKTVDGKNYYKDNNNLYWRCYHYMDDCYTFESVASAKIFESAAKTFGKFQCLLNDYPIDTLHDTIPNFHNTVSRFADFHDAINADPMGRKKEVIKEIEFALENESEAGLLLALQKSGEIPTRVTHNDTKINNVLFDNKTNEAFCLIDLDTVLPGLSLYDFGDGLRSGASSAAEDEENLDKVYFDVNLYKSYTRGFLSSTGKNLTKAEIEYLPFSAKLMALECAIRFLGDYLNGDVYFRIKSPTHNLIRCKTQLTLVRDIEKKMPQLQEIAFDSYKEIMT